MRFAKAQAPTPRFGYLIRLGLESIGVHYVSIDLLRKAKKNRTTEHEYWVLWRLLHDLVLVELAGFEIDRREFELLNDAGTLRSALLDAKLHKIQMELVRFYLYDWGFVCSELYSKTVRPSSQILLLAIAWLFAFSNFFERQHRDVIERYMGSKQLHLPPFPDNVDISFESAQLAAANVLSTAVEVCDKKLPLEGRMHQLHCGFGRLQSQLNEFKAYVRYIERLSKRLKALQDMSKACQDEMIPAYVLDLVMRPTEILSEQVQVLAQSVQMIEDEQMFYKWINSLVLALEDDSKTSNTQADSSALPNKISESLHAEIHKVQTLFEKNAEIMQQVERIYEEEWNKWVYKQKSCLQQSWKAKQSSHIMRGAREIYVVTKDDIEQLQSQMTSIIGEISQGYCDLQLQ
ncbi:Domain of unknown function DUF4509 [Plasmopara halstedii]|uniref:Uncharacterized protein n=1 Tax=Plasmopara halstedii TaxID=4781 RepID=A0A0P1A9H3_PLAHL|nr:Domain of unknown function DUF4509 [Plasmopara halstedii]CEG36976.1 Domain of unknown function DUF4509 [Plasmopara halstedii]|eukprot:XP_024573345.1 Domain of unknown function DUF4509 [Plasmopara halstedii]